MIRITLQPKQFCSKKSFNKLIKKINDDGLRFVAIGYISYFCSKNVPQVVVYTTDDGKTGYKNIKKMDYTHINGSLSLQKDYISNSDRELLIYHTYDEMLKEHGKRIKGLKTVEVGSYLKFAWHIAFAVPTLIFISLSSFFVCLMNFNFSSFTDKILNYNFD